MRLGIVADSHVSVDRFEPVRWHNEFDLRGSRSRLRRALSHDLLAEVETVLVLGDLVHWGDRASLRALVDEFEDWARPAVLLQGNHDVLEPEVHLEDEVGDAKLLACMCRV